MTYFLTFTTYGTHLPGDTRGSSDRRGAPLEVSSAMETFARNLMPEGPFRLEGAEDRRTVRDAIVEVCGYRRWHLLALHVRPEHVHGLVQAEGVGGGRVMGDWKRYSSRALRSRWPYRRQFWTGGGSTRSVNGSGLNRIVRYILDEQGEPLETYDANNPPLTRWAGDPNIQG